MKVLGRGFLLSVLGMGYGFSAGLPVAEIAREEPVDYASEVFPVLKKNCLACHNSTKAKAGLNMETPALMIEGGDSGTSLVPGDPAESWVFLSAAHLEDPQMPPPKNKSNAKELTAEQLGLLKRWIAEGAEGGSELGRDVPLEWRDDDAVSDGAPIYHLAMEGGGKRVAFAKGRRVFVYNIAAGAIEGELVDPAVAGGGAHLDYVQSLTFSPSGQLITGGFRTVKVWGAEGSEGEAGGVWKAAGEERVAAGVFSDGGGMVIGGGDGKVRVWSGGKAAVFEGHGKAVAMVDAGASGAGRMVSSDVGGDVIVWTLADGKVLKRWTLDGGVRDLAISADGQRVVGLSANGQRLSLWNVDEGKKIADLEAAGRERGVLAKWERLKGVETGLVAERVKQRDTAKKQVEDDKKRRDEAVAAAAKDAEAAGVVAKELASLEAQTDAEKEDAEAKKKLDEKKKAFEAAEKKRVASERNREVAGRLLGRAEEKLMIAEEKVVTAEGRVVVMGQEIEKAKAVVESVKDVVWSGVGFSEQGGLVVATREVGKALAWGAASGDAVREIDVEGGVVGFSRRGEVVVGERSIGATVNWGLVKQLGAVDDVETVSDRVSALAVSADGHWLAVGTGVPSRSGELRLWDMGTWEAGWRLEDAHSDTINAIAFEPHGECLVTAGSDRLVRRFDAKSGELLETFEGHGSYVTSIAMRADGLRIASGGTDNTVRVWELEGGKSLETKKGFKRGVGAVAFVGGGNQLVSASGDPVLKIDNDVLFNSGDYIHCAAVSDDGALVAGGGHDGVLRVWRVADKKLVAEVKP